MPDLSPVMTEAAKAPTSSGKWACMARKITMRVVKMRKRQPPVGGARRSTEGLAGSIRSSLTRSSVSLTA